MYDIALSVAAFVRANTRADVAWVVAPDTSDEAVAFTPGGGRTGVLENGAFDDMLADIAQRRLPRGRHVVHQVSDVEAAVSGRAPQSQIEFLLVPCDQFPDDVWPALVERHVVTVRATVIDGEVTGIDVSRGDVARAMASDAGDDARRDTADKSDDRAVVIETIVRPVTRLLVAGAGPIADALADQGRLLGWKVVQEASPGPVMGYAAQLSHLDACVVIGHDVESSGRNLMAVLEGPAGYIGAVGSQAMQDARADWLAYREVTDLSRVHGPAGLNIGARTPAEVAVAIVAEIVATMGDV